MCTSRTERDSLHDLLKLFARWGGMPWVGRQ
jgi:hypothetical protein